MINFGSHEEKQVPFLKDFIADNPEKVNIEFTLKNFFPSERGIFITTTSEAFNVFVFKGSSVHQSITQYLEMTKGEKGYSYEIVVVPIDTSGGFEINTTDKRLCVIDELTTSRGKDYFACNHFQKSTKRKLEDLMEFLKPHTT